jgi:hypothetical protein
MKGLIVFSFFLCLFAHNSNGQEYTILEHTTGGEGKVNVARKMVIGKDGHVYTAGIMKDSFTVNGNTVNALPAHDGIYLAKFTNDLSLIWLKKVVDIKGTYIEGYKLMMAIDSSDNVIIGHSYISGSDVTYDDSIHVQTDNIQLMKLDSFGERLWRTEVGGSKKLGDKGVAVDKQNNILITGIGLNDDAFITKYDADGNEVWYQTAGVHGQIGNTPKTDEGIAISIDNNNNIYATGMLYINGNPDTAYFDTYQIVFPASYYSVSYLVKYAPDGTLEWVRYVYSSSPTLYSVGYGGSSTITSIATLENGSVAVGGFYTNSLLQFSDGLSSVVRNGGTIGYRASFLANFDSNGNRLWAKSLHNVNNGNSYLVDLSADNTSSVYLLHNYYGTIVNERGDTCPSKGSIDLMLEKYDENGILNSQMRMGGSSHDFANNIVATDNNVFTYSLTGSQGGTPFYYAEDSLVFNTEYLNNVLIVKLMEDLTLDITKQPMINHLELFPNPNNGVFSVRLPETEGKISIYDHGGRIVKEIIVEDLQQEVINIDIQNNANGVYLLHFTSKNHSVTGRLIKN